MEFLKKSCDGLLTRTGDKRSDKNIIFEKKENQSFKINKTDLITQSEKKIRREKTIFER